MRTIYWHAPNSTGFVRSSLDDLRRWLANEPLHKPVEFIQVENGHRAVVESFFSDECLRKGESCSDDTLKYVDWSKECHARLRVGLQLSSSSDIPDHVIYCPDMSPSMTMRLRVLVLKNNDKAEDGSQYESLALILSPDNPQVIWHETLHLLGARDCYSNGIPLCPRKPNKCVMQWIPAPEKKPDLCETALTRIRKHSFTWNEKYWPFPAIGEEY